MSIGLIPAPSAGGGGTGGYAKPAGGIPLSDIDLTGFDSRYVLDSSLANQPVAIWVDTAPTTETGLVGDQRVLRSTGDIYELQAGGSWLIKGNVGSGLYVPSKWLRYNIGANSSSALTAGVLYLMRVRLLSDNQLWSDFSVNVTTGAATGGKLNLAIMPDLGGAPDFASAVEKQFDSTTAVRKIFTPDLPIAMRGGIHRSMWAGLLPLGANCNVNCALSPEPVPFDSLPSAGTAGYQAIIGSGASPLTGPIASVPNGTTLNPSNSTPFELLLKRAAA